MSIMLRRLFILTVLISLFAVIAALPLQADGTWSAWLYDHQQGIVWRVDNTGNVQDEIALPAPTGSHFSEELLISRDGRYIGYTLDGQQFALYDTTMRNLAFTYTIPDAVITDSFDLGVSAEQFSEDGTRVAYAYLHADGWRIMLLDTITGALIANLDQAATPSTPTFGVPLLFDVTDARVLFNLPGMSPAWTGYAWDIPTGGVSPTGMQLDDEYALFRRTGDLIMPGDLASSALSDAPDALLVYHTLSGQRFPFYAAPGALLRDPRFIQNGERIVVSMETQTGEAPLVVERDGQTVGSLDVPCDIDATFGVPDGLICIPNGQLWAVDTRVSLDSARVVAEFSPGVTIAAVISAPEGIASYEGWANVAREPVVAPVYTPAPSLHSVAPDHVGFDAATLVYIGTRAAQPVFELTPHFVVTLAPPS